MKQVIGCAFCLVLLALGSPVVLAENTLTTENPTEKNISSIIKNPSPEDPASEKSSTASALSEHKTPKPLPGEFPVMSQPDVGNGIIQVTLGLFAVLLIIAGAAWFTRRFGHFQATAGGALRIVGGLHLGTREKLVVVQVGEEQLLLGVAPGRVSTLHVLSKPLQQDESMTNRTQQVSGAFLDKLNAVLNKGR